MQVINSEAPPAAAPAATPAFAETPRTPAGGSDYFNNVLNEIQNTNFDEPAPAVMPEPVKTEEPKPVVEPAKPVETPVPATDEKQEADKDDIDKIEEPKGSAAAENFKKIKETAKGYKSKMIAAEGVIEAQKTEFQAKEAEYLQQIEELKALTTGELIELRGKKETFEAAEKKLAVFDVTSTVEFENTIIKPLKAIDDRLQKIAKSNEVSYDELADIVSEPDYEKQREAALAMLPSLNDFDRLAFSRMLEDARPLLDKRSEIIENAENAKKEIKEREEREAKESKGKATETFKASVKNTVESLAKRMPFVALTDGETAEGVLKGILDKASAEDFDAATPITKGTAAVSVLALERAILQAQKQEDYIKTLEARVAEANRGKATVGDGPEPAPAPKSEEGPLFGGIHDFLKLQHSHTVKTPQML